VADIGGGHQCHGPQTRIRGLHADAKKTSGLVEGRSADLTDGGMSHPLGGQEVGTRINEDRISRLEAGFLSFPDHLSPFFFPQTKKTNAELALG
jgi:hypothetical protein